MVGLAVVEEFWGVMGIGALCSSLGGNWNMVSWVGLVLGGKV
jgi:hypothetical protein